MGVGHFCLNSKGQPQLFLCHGRTLFGTMISAHCHENEYTSVTFRVPFCSLSYHFLRWNFYTENVFVFHFFLNVPSLFLLGFRGSRCGSLFPPAYLMKTSRGNRSLTTLFVRQRWVNICVQFFSFFRLCLPHYRETPSSVSLLLSPPAHPIDSLSPCTSLLDSQFETRFLSMERAAVVQSNCSDCPCNVFSTLLSGLRLSETLLNYQFQKPQIESF